MSVHNSTQIYIDSHSLCLVTVEVHIIMIEICDLIFVARHRAIGIGSIDETPNVVAVPEKH